LEEERQVKLEDNADLLQERAMEEGVKSTKGLIQDFLQTLKSYRLYESNHPVLSRYLEKLKKDFDHYFDEFDSFSLQVGEHRLFYRGKVVYESQDVRESLAFLFFRDGIREIQFIRELEFREVVDFLEVVRSADTVNRFEDDLVTLLWEKDFSHIMITTVDEFLEEGIGLVPATEEDLVNKMEYRGGEGASGGEGEKEAEPPGVGAEGIRQALNLVSGQSLVQACQLTPQEATEIKRTTRREQESDYVFILIDNLIEILLHLGEDMDAYENMIAFFERTIDSLLEQKEIRKAVMVLKNLNDTMESIALKDKQIFAVRRIIESISGPRPIELLGKAIKGNGEKESDAIQECLRLTTKQAIEPLCKILGELDSGKWRKIICDHLAEACREDIQPLVKFLTHPNPMLICHILYILGKIEHPSTVKYLRNLAVHANPKVREETLQVLARLGMRGKDLVFKFLGDPLPSIRGRASLTLARIAKGDAVKPLMAIILSEDFFKRELDEKSSFFRALGETRAKEVIPALEKIARKRKWFQKAKWQEMRLCAANALKVIETGESADKEKAARVEQVVL
jgi:hypothetical protein